MFHIQIKNLHLNSFTTLQDNTVVQKKVTVSKNQAHCRLLIETFEARNSIKKNNPIASTGFISWGDGSEGEEGDMNEWNFLMGYFDGSVI